MALVAAIGAAFATGWAAGEFARGEAGRASFVLILAVLQVLLFVHFELDACRKCRCGEGE